VAKCAAELSAQIFQVSSKTGENINELFTQVARDALEPQTQFKQEILASIADINKKNDEGETFLHRCARLGFGELVRMLIDFGADRTIKTARITLTFS